MPKDVVIVKTLPDYQLELKYNDGEFRRFDMKPLLVMKPWNKIATPYLFEKARVEYGTVVWPGEIDIAPETLYDDSFSITLHEATEKYGENIELESNKPTKA